MSQTFNGSIRKPTNTLKLPNSNIIQVLIWITCSRISSYPQLTEMFVISQCHTHQAHTENTHCDKITSLKNSFFSFITVHSCESSSWNSVLTMLPFIIQTCHTTGSALKHYNIGSQPFSYQGPLFIQHLSYGPPCIWWGFADPKRGIFCCHWIVFSPQLPTVLKLEPYCRRDNR